ncbi:hypothetical protein ACIP8Z_00350 [Streptomyces sp. NPDC088553]|uniref:hypothetical protein n=1 Tax=Streptomyces sp. NPDC088553 TaxID=3365864 RepID=UPI0037F18F8B
MLDAEDDDAGQGAEGDGDRQDRLPDPYRPGPEDHVWVAVLVVIVVVLVLVGIMSNMDVNNSGDPAQDWDTVWH